MFCYKCGRECELIDGLCPDCYSELSALMDIKEKYDITVCSNCDSFLMKEWKEFKLIEDIVEAVVREASGKRKVVFVDEFYEPRDLSVLVRYELVLHEEYVSVEAEAYGYPDSFSKMPRREEHSFLVFLRYTTCPRCSKLYGGYYEATFQIRRESRFLTKEESEAFILEVDEMSKAELERNGMAFVTKIVRKKEGPEFQMGSLKFTKKLARALQKKHGGQVSESFRMTGYDRQEGKPRYRGTVVLRLSQFEEGKFVLYDGTLWRISNMADKVTLANFGQALSLDFKKIEKESSSGNLKMVADDALVPGMMVSVGEGGSQVMRMDDYSTIELDPENVPGGAVQGEKVLMLKEGARYYLVNP